MRRSATGLVRGRGPARGVLDTLRGYRHGLRRRAPVRPEVSRFYRRNFEPFANPLPLVPGPLELARILAREARRGTALRSGRAAAILRRDAFFARAAGYTRTSPRSSASEGPLPRSPATSIRAL